MVEKQRRLTEWAQELAAVGAVERRVDSLGCLDSLGLGHDGAALGGGGCEHLLLHHGGHFEGKVDMDVVKREKGRRRFLLALGRTAF